MDTKWKPRLLRKAGQDNILNGILTLIEGRAPLKEKKVNWKEKEYVGNGAVHGFNRYNMTF